MAYASLAFFGKFGAMNFVTSDRDSELQSAKALRISRTLKYVEGTYAFHSRVGWGLRFRISISRSQFAVNKLPNLDQSLHIS